jgi:hypothetical protein
MVDQIIYYISAAKDVERERDVLTRLTTDIPTTLRWKIQLTPIKGERLDHKTLEEADFHVLILGSDIRAPVGMEWSISMKVGKRPHLLKKSGVLHTPAAEEFVRGLERYQTWITFKDNQELRKIVLNRLVDHIIENGIYYALQPKEYDKLVRWRKELESEVNEISEDAARVTGESSILLSRERYVPSGGILINTKSSGPKPEEK